MVRTRVGFGNQAEVVQLDYDPAQISYERLLELFWKQHQPNARGGSRLYAKVVLYHNSRQKRAALASLLQQQQKFGQVSTTVEPLAFSASGSSQQKYYLQHSQHYPAFQRHFRGTKQLLDSTVAARLNAFAGGHLAKNQLIVELRKAGLKPGAVSELIR